MCSCCKKCNQKIATKVPSSFVDICIHLCSSASTKAFWSQIVKAHTRRIMAADGNVSFEDALNATNSLKLVNLDKGPQFLEPHMCSGHFDATDLPMKPMDLNAASMKRYIEIINDVQMENVSHEQLKQIFLEKRFHDLPPPFGFKSSPGMAVKVNWVLFTREDGKKLLLKDINLDKKVKASFIKSISHGDLYAFTWEGNVKNVVKAIVYMIHNMKVGRGGFICMCQALKPEGNSSEAFNFHEQDADDLDRGFDFIQQEGPRENVKNIQLRWITKQLNNPKSPIHKWPERLVEKSLRNLANDGVLAQLVTDFHFTLADVNVCALKELIPILRLCREKSLGFHGTAGFGKTPLARIICMAFSRYWVNKVKSKDDQDFARPANLIFFVAKWVV